MFRVTKEFEFEAAHRLMGHTGKCRNLHGHSYRAVIVIESFELDNLGMTIDFGKIKEVVGSWIEEKWDHNTILHEHDVLLSMSWIGQKRPYIMDNPTAENMAKELYGITSALLDESRVEDVSGDIKVVSVTKKVVSVTIHETRNCSATYEVK